MPSETTTACVSLLVFFRIRRGTFPYGVEYDASTISQTPTTHYTNICVKLTIVTHLSCSERIAIANLSYIYIMYQVLLGLTGLLASVRAPWFSSITGTEYFSASGITNCCTGAGHSSEPLWDCHKTLPLSELRPLYPVELS